jgi:hypothetical protein
MHQQRPIDCSSFAKLPLPARVTYTVPIAATISPSVTLTAALTADPGCRVETAGIPAAVLVIRAASTRTDDISAGPGTVLTAEKVSRGYATEDGISRLAVNSWGYALLVIDGDDLAIVEFDVHGTDNDGAVRSHADSDLRGGLI